MKKIEKLEKDPIGFISKMETVVNEDIEVILANSLLSFILNMIKEIPILLRIT